jgi:hypothetical protein
MDDPPTREARRWLAENATADLQSDRLPSQGLGRAVSYDADGVDPAELIETDEQDRKKRRRTSSHEQPPPTEAPTRGEYRAARRPRLTQANHIDANANRSVWTGGRLVGRYDYDLEPDEERELALQEIADDDPVGDDEVPFESWDGDGDDLDDRPLWQRELDLSDDDLEDERLAAESPPETPAVPELTMCARCGQNPIKYKKKGWCARCHEFQRTHQGQLPPPRLTVGRRYR